MTIYSPDVLLPQFGTSLLFYVQFKLFLFEVHTDFSRGRSGGLIFPSFEEFSTVFCDPWSSRDSQESPPTPQFKSINSSAFFTVQLSHPYTTTGKTIALTRRTFVGKVISLLFTILSRFVITFLPRSKRLLILWL